MSMLNIQFPTNQKKQLHDFCHELLERLQLQPSLHSGEQAFPVTLDLDTEEARLSIIPILPDFQLMEHGPIVIHKVSQLLGEFIVSHIEGHLLNSMIIKKTNKMTGFDCNEIAAYCYKLLNGDPWEHLGRRFHEEDSLRRKNKVAEELKSYFETNTTIDLNGYIHFRLFAYKKELEEVVEYAFDEYILDQQYEEFITLLKYFVQLQETKIHLVHLVQIEGSTFSLYNESIKPLELKPDPDRIVAEMLETEMNIEDMVISSLISASPEVIVLHAQHMEYQVIRTIQTIFGDRVKVCKQCPICKTNSDEILP